MVGQHYSSGSSLIQLDPRDTRWLEFADSVPGSTAFHHPAWLDVLAETDGREGLVLAQLDAEGAVVAGLPLARVRRRPLSSIAYVCMPFADHCPPLARDQASLQLLAENLVRWGDLDERAHRLEVRAELPCEAGWATTTVGFHHTVPLTGDRVTAWSRLKPSIARTLKKAQNKGLRVRLSHSRDDLATFYRLHLLTRRRLGVPVQPRRFFASIWMRLIEPGLGFCLLAETKERETAAAGLLLAHNGTLIARYAGSDPSHWHLKPNDLIQWTAMEWGCDHGFKTLDLGRCHLDNEGLRSFKLSYGAQEVPLQYSTAPPSSIKSKGTSPMRRTMQEMIKHSPPMLCGALGELLQRYAA